MKRLVNGTSYSPILNEGRKKTINVSRWGLPFGCMWTWKDTKTEQHPWHVKTLNGNSTHFWPKDCINAKYDAMDWIEHQ